MIRVAFLTGASSPSMVVLCPNTIPIEPYSILHYQTFGYLDADHWMLTPPTARMISKYATTFGPYVRVGAGIVSRWVTCTMLRGGGRGPSAKVRSALGLCLEGLHQSQIEASLRLRPQVLRRRYVSHGHCCRGKMPQPSQVKALPNPLRNIETISTQYLETLAQSSSMTILNASVSLFGHLCPSR